MSRKRTKATRYLSRHSRQQVEANSKLTEQITTQRKEIERLRSLTWA